MTPRPRHFHKIEEKRLPKRKRKPLTIALGFTSLPGAILCSDTQMTSDSGFKFEESKMLNPIEWDGWGIFGTYAGSPAKARAVEYQMGEYCHELIERDRKAVPTIKQLERQLQKVIVQVSRKHRGPLQMLWVISLKKYLHMYRIDQKTLTPVYDFSCLGIGDSSLVRFLLDNLRSVRTQDAARGAAYIVQQAMKYVDGVGGSTEIWAIYRGGRWKALKTGALKPPSVQQHKLFRKLTSETSE